jgi:hypothetical protein
MGKMTAKKFEASAKDKAADHSINAGRGLETNFGRRNLNGKRLCKNWRRT